MSPLLTAVIRQFNTDGVGANINYACEDETGGVRFSAATNNLIYWKNGRLDLRPSIPQNLWDLFLRRAYHIDDPCLSGGVWRLENGRVRRWNGAGLVKDLGPFPWPSAPVPANFSASYDPNVTCECEDHEGNLIVGVKGAGIYLFNSQGGRRQISNHDGLFQGNVYSLFIDRDDNLWVGTDGGGLYRVKKNDFTSPPELATGVMLSLAEDASGGLWVQDNIRGVIYYKTNSLHDYVFGAWSVLVDQTGQVWAGTRGDGLFRLAAGSFPPRPPTPPRRVRKFMRSSKVATGGFGWASRKWPCQL